MSDVHVTDAGITGYLWGATAGWIVMNCSNTSTGCSPGNGNFHVAVAPDGTLSGFAWGENTGWINFGPFSGISVPHVKIEADGFLRGTGGSAVGYAWSENFGWIVFDCSTATNCVYTDYVPAEYRQTSGGGGGAVGTATQCSNGIDDDGDGYFDMNDPDCGGGSTSEFPPGVIPVVPPVLPGTTDPEYPDNGNVLPPTPSTPVEPTVPSNEEGEPSNPIDVITDIFTGESSVPEARDRVIGLFNSSIEWFKEFFGRLSVSVVQLMNIPSSQDILLQVALVGLAIITLLSILLAIFVPAISFIQMTVFPQLLWQNILYIVGVSNSRAPWGIVYNSATHQPLPLTTVAIIDSTNSVVRTVVTASDGTFGASVADGVYTLSFGSQGTMVVVDTSALIYDSVYTPGSLLRIVNGQPEVQFDVAVHGTALSAPEITSFKEFLLYHEVSLTNLSFVIFGVGLLASVLYTIFFPSMIALCVILIYLVVALLRAIGMFGSYASVFLRKDTDHPLQGTLVTIFNKYTNTSVAKALTSRFGRAYLNLPEGYFYATVSTPLLEGKEGMVVITKPFASRTGLFRKRFSL